MIAARVGSAGYDITSEGRMNNGILGRHVTGYKGT